MDNFEFDYENATPQLDDEPFRFACTVLTRQQYPLLATPKLAQLTLDCLLAINAKGEGQLWGYVVLPDAVHCVLEVDRERDYHHFVEQFKTTSEVLLSEAIRREYENLLDAITLFNPAWTETIYRVWQDGYHSQALASPYAVSNRVADLVQKPVTLGLVAHMADWKFSSYRANDT